jgi:hypothetical protein
VRARLLLGDAPRLATYAGAGRSAPGCASRRCGLLRFIVFVAYDDNAAHSNLVGGATFNDCPNDDPSYRCGAQTELHTIESEPCP